MTDLFASFTSGCIAHQNNTTDAKSLPWNPHPSLIGVSLKHLITGSETEGRFSVHLVKLDADAEISDHIHEDSWELHEIAGGEGYCILDGKRIPYEPGVVTVLPKKVKHSVQAGENGLFIMAKFIPALL